MPRVGERAPRAERRGGRPTRTSTFRFGRPENLTHLVITADAPLELLTLFRDDGVEVITV